MKRTTITIASVGLALLCTILVVLIPPSRNKPIDHSLIPCERCATANQPLISPSGKYKLLVEIKKDDQSTRFYAGVIKDTNNKVVATTDLYPLRHRTAFAWDRLDNLWIYSGDTGTFVIIRDSGWKQLPAPSYETIALCPPKEFINVIYKGNESFRQCL